VATGIPLPEAIEEFLRDEASPASPKEAGDGARSRDIDLGTVARYQLNPSRSIGAVLEGSSCIAPEVGTFVQPLERDRAS